VSVQRVFAHRPVAAELGEGLAQRARCLRVGDPLLAETKVGPLIRPREVPRIRAWVEEVTGWGADCRMSTQEVLGPVVYVYAYDDLDEAIRQANVLPCAFQAAVFTRDYATAMHAYTRLDASAIMLDDHTASRVDWMPFGDPG
jgi:acyl-CoA reductase-like NAD-dependent aldehyde dehydrogenase